MYGDLNNIVTVIVSKGKNHIQFHRNCQNRVLNKL